MNIEKITRELFSRITGMLLNVTAIIKLISIGNLKLLRPYIISLGCVVVIKRTAALIAATILIPWNKP